MIIMMFSKKKKNLASEFNVAQDQEMYDRFFKEISTVESQLENVKHQMKFFGSTFELKNEKQDIELLLAWLREQYRHYQAIVPDAES